MKVLMFTTIFPPAIGGPATQCFNLCTALLERGVKPVVVTYGETFSRKMPHGYPVYTFRRFYGLGPADRLLRWLVFPFYVIYVLRREKIDVIHCHSVNMLSFIAAAVAKIFAIPRVIKFAGDWVWETVSAHGLQGEDFKAVYVKNFYTRFLTVIERAGLKLFNVIWTPSQFRRQNVEYLIGRKVKTVIIPNCLLLNNNVLPVRPRKTVTIVSANRFIPHKRLPLLIEAYAQLAGPFTELVLIGGGDDDEVVRVKEKVRELRIDQSVRLTGVLSQKEVYEQFNRASFYVSTSIEEGFPNVFIEAMNSGLPIIATDLGGSKELVVDGVTGFMVRPDNKSGLVQKMKMLAKNVPLREQMARAAFERSQLFDLRKRVGDFIELYQGLLSA